MGRVARGSRFSERAFHGWLAREFRDVPTGRLPLGDDAAAIPLGGKRVAVLTTDALIEGTHFLGGSPPASIGRAAAAVSLSDAAAKGAAPVALLLDLLVPPSTPESWARAVVRGAEREMARFGGHVVGGDTKPSSTRTVVGSLLALGHADRLCPRTAGRPGDVLVVTGVVGRGGADAEALVRDRPSPSALARLLHVRPRVAEGAVLSRYAHAMLDTSDGLAESVHLLADASGVEVAVTEGDLPLDTRVTRGARSLAARRRLAFFGGDYELLAALPLYHLDTAERALARLGCPLTSIGLLGKGRGAWLQSYGTRKPMPRGGWDPFRRAGLRSRAP